VARIFVVDDEVYLQDLYSDLLTMVGHEIVDRAFNGEEAVIKYEAMASPPDLVIMDHRMPIKNGMEATREILDLDPGARVLFISADLSQEGGARRIGAVGFLEKPFPMDRLFHTITRVLEQAKASAPTAR
jgi:two-component system chemotaxis response regulator CheY